MIQKSNNAPRTTLITFFALLAVVFVVSFEMIKPYLMAVVMGAILALLCYPLYMKISGEKKKSKTASTIVTCGLLLVVIGPCALFLALSVKEGITMARSISESQELSFEQAVNKAVEFPIVREFVDDPAALERQMKSGIQTAAKGASTAALGIAANVPEFLLQLTLTAIACFFFLIDGTRFLKWANDKTPLDESIKEKLSKEFKNTTVSVIWATLAAAGAQAGLMLVSFLILGVPAAFLAGGATFILAWVPMIGSVPVWISGAAYLFVKGSVAKGVIMIVLGLITGLIDNIIRPLVLQGRGEMHPLVSLVAIFGGIQMFGILGVFLGPIIAAILILLFNIWPDVANRFGLITKE